MVGSIIWVLFEIYLSFQQSQNFESLLRTDKVIVMSLVYYFFGRHSLYYYYSVNLSAVKNT